MARLPLATNQGRLSCNMSAPLTSNMCCVFTPQEVGHGNTGRHKFVSNTQQRLTCCLLNGGFIGHVWMFTCFLYIKPPPIRVDFESHVDSSDFSLPFSDVCFWRINEGMFPVCDVGCSVSLSFSLNWNSGRAPPVLVFWSKSCVSSGESARAKEHSIHLCTSSDGLKEKGLPVWGIFRLVQQGHVLVCNDRTRWL